MPINVGDLGDGGHSEGINVRAAASAVALKIALQLLATLRDGQLITRARKVIHADIDVAVVFGEPLDDGFEQLQLDLGRRQDFMLQNLLGGLYPGHMRIAKNRQPIRLQGEHDVQRAIE